MAAPLQVAFGEKGNVANKFAGISYFLLPQYMPKEQFQFPESGEIWSHISTAAKQSHHDHQRAFDDLLSMCVCSLSGGQMEDEYLKAVKPYCSGEIGNRAIDALAQAFAALINAMDATRNDYLGDMFCGTITHGLSGQFFTPEAVCS